MTIASSSTSLSSIEKLVKTFRPLIIRSGSSPVFGQLISSPASLAKVHKDMINGQAVQPRGERTFTTIGIQLAKYLDKDLLREIFRFCSIPSHPQAHGINSSVMKFEEFLKRR